MQSCGEDFLVEYLWSGKVRLGNEMKWGRGRGRGGPLPLCLPEQRGGFSVPLLISSSSVCPAHCGGDANLNNGCWLNTCFRSAGRTRAGLLLNVRAHTKPCNLHKGSLCAVPLINLKMATLSFLYLIIPLRNGADTN